MSELQTLVAILVFVGLLFGLYRLLVQQKDASLQQKDANIKVLRDQLAARDKRIQELETQSPDALVKNLSNRVTESLKEIERLNADKESHAAEIMEKQASLSALQDKLRTLTSLIADSDLVCPTCGAPLAHRVLRTIHGYVGGREAEADVEYLEYECGYAYDGNDGLVHPCPNNGDEPVIGAKSQ